MLITLADDGVDLPVADLRAKLGGEGSLADVPFAGEAAAAVVSAVAFAAPFLRTAKVRVERSAEHAIAPDVAVDGFVADRERTAQPAADLLGAPAFAKQSFDGAQIGARFAQRVKPEYLRMALAVIVLLVAARMAVDLFIRPDEIYTVQ